MLKQILFYATTLALALAILIYVAINLTRQPLIALFNNENNETLRAYASTGLLLYFIGFIFAGLNIVFAAYLSAAHNPKAAFAISITRGFVAIIPVVLLLAHFWGIVGVWLAFPCTEGITFLVSWFCIRQKNLAKPFQLAHNHAK